MSLIQTLLKEVEASYSHDSHPYLFHINGPKETTQKISFEVRDDDPDPTRGALMLEKYLNDLASEFRGYCVFNSFLDPDYEPPKNVTVETITPRLFDRAVVTAVTSTHGGTTTITLHFSIH